MTDLVDFLADAETGVGRPGPRAIDLSAESTVDNQHEYALGP